MGPSTYHASWKLKGQCDAYNFVGRLLLLRTLLVVTTTGSKLFQFRFQSGDLPCRTSRIKILIRLDAKYIVSFYCPRVTKSCSGKIQNGEMGYAIVPAISVITQRN